MTDQYRLDMIDWHRECNARLTAGLDRMPEPPDPEDIRYAVNRAELEEEDAA